MMPPQRKDRWVVVLAGLLAGSALPPIGLWPLAIPGYALLLAGLRRGDQSTLFKHMMIFLAGAWGVPFHWVVFHPVPAAAASSLSALMAYAVLMAALTSFVVSRLPERLPDRDMSAVLSLAGFDILLARGPLAMPWLSPGLSVADASWAAGWASLAGFHGVTLALLLLAMVVARLVQDRNGRTAAGMLALLLIALPFPRRTFSEDASLLSVAMVEPGWPPNIWSMVDDTSRVSRLEDLTNALPASDLVVFPETALPVGDVDQLARWTAQLSAAVRAPVLAGGIERGIESGVARNVAISSEETTPYAKRHLVPFAEHVPFSNWIPFFSRLSVPSGGVEAYEPGRLLTPLPAGSVTAGVLICFESLFARDARSLANMDADVLVVITQDGWWDSEAARTQHAAFSRLLAAAVGIPVIHATVDGQSQAIDATGRVLPVRMHGRVHTAELPRSPVKTPFKRTGDWPFFAIFAALLLFQAPHWARLRRVPHPA